MKRLVILLLCVISIAALLLFLKPAKPAQSQAESQPQAAPVVTAAPFDSTVMLRVLTEQGTEELPLDAYLMRVLLAEMPSDFPPEALKAQAVAARTFALRRSETKKHEFADICSDPSCCQGCCDATEIPQSITDAVLATDGLVMTYDGALIDATFFSCSGGKTEAALAVWGSDIPYLQSVESPGEENAPRYTEEALLSAEYFAEVLSSAHPEVNLAGQPENWFGACSYTEGGGVDKVFIGGAAIAGTELRKLFSLRSTKFTIAAQDGQVCIVTCGFGHRVGLSQYGAKSMAERGAAFAEILTHYYQGAAVTQLQNPAVIVPLAAP